jgi:predicted porin
MIQSSISQRALKRTLVSAALLALSAGAVQAQTVTLYGRIDAGFQYQNKTGVNGDSKSELANGGILPSIWGLRGSEDLGGGLKAVFNLESDFDSGTGASRGLGGGSTVFTRSANVGLAGDWGKVLLGRQYSVALLADLAVDPRGFKESLSSLSTYALTQAPGGNANTGNNTLGIFTGNAISYSNSFGPLAVGVSYAFGEVANETSRGSTVALGVTYAGPITVSGSYQEIKGINGVVLTPATITPPAPAVLSNDGKTQRYSIGAAVPFDAFTFKAYYADAKTDENGTETSHTENFGIGADYAWNAQNTATAAYYRGKDKKLSNATTSSFILSNDYALSKRTTIYAQYAYVDRDANAPGSTTIDFGGSTPGEKNSIFGIGIKHDF